VETWVIIRAIIILLGIYLFVVVVLLLNEVYYKKKPWQEVFQKPHIKRIALRTFIGLLIAFLAAYLYAIFGIFPKSPRS
jgi:lysylphosphatidylglycerol synthetase-like protein (DUF2156 family)